MARTIAEVHFEFGRSLAVVLAKLDVHVACDGNSEKSREPEEFVSNDKLKSVVAMVDKELLTFF